MAYHLFAIPNGNGTARKTTSDKVAFDETGLMDSIVPTLESVGDVMVSGCGQG